MPYAPSIQMFSSFTTFETYCVTYMYYKCECVAYMYYKCDSVLHTCTTNVTVCYIHVLQMWQSGDCVHPQPYVNTIGKKWFTWFMLSSVRQCNFLIFFLCACSVDCINLFNFTVFRYVIFVNFTSVSCCNCISYGWVLCGWSWCAGFCKHKISSVHSSHANDECCGGWNA